MLFLLFHLFSFSTFAQTPITAQINDSAQELIELRKQQQKAVESITFNNPLSQVFGTESNQKIDWIRNFFNHPVIRALYQFFSSQKFMQAASKIVQHPHKIYVVYAELILFLIMMLYRAWRTSVIPKSSWTRILWLHFYTSIVYLALAMTLVPWIVFGEPYRQILGSFAIFLGF